MSTGHIDLLKQKKVFALKIECNSQRLFRLEHPHGRRHVMWEHSLHFFFQRTERTRKALNSILVRIRECERVCAPNCTVKGPNDDGVRSAFHYELTPPNPKRYRQRAIHYTWKILILYKTALSLIFGILYGALCIQKFLRWSKIC